MELLPVGRPWRALRVVLCAFVLGLALAGSARAQVLDSKGKEFWVAFMANWGSARVDQSSDLRIYLSCDRPTTVTITYTLDGASQVVAIPVTNQTQEVNVNQLFGDFVELDDVSGANEISAKSLHIISNDEISLYGANIRAKSADAFLGLPIDVLTGRYIVLAYPNGYLGTTATSGRYDMPSEFAVVATEDGTSVLITPPSGLTINRRPAAPFTINLQRGQVFFGQADVFDQREQDVSGTQVLASKPVAVFGGNKRTSIPTRVGNFRDHLVEQLTPLNAWGKNALLTPHFKVTPESGDTAVARILAAFPGTSVTVTRASGSTVYALSTAASFEIPLTESMNVTATQPILVAQYEHSVAVIDSNGFDIGDPFMMLIPPSEQFDTAYAFQSIVHQEFVNQHYINVVIPAVASASIALDGVRVSGRTFLPIPGSRYVYAQMRVTAGSHYIRADSAFGLYVYGFGAATSYGYPGGMLFRKLVTDFEAPEIAWEQQCNELTGRAYDNRITDTGIDSCYATRDTQNVAVTVDPFKLGADTVRYTARLIDPYQDGVVGIAAIDSAGHARTFTNPIPGFTLRAANSTSVPATLDTFVVMNSRNFCRAVQIRNYGKFKQKIMGANLVLPIPGSSIASDQFPIEIQPGGFASIQVCFDNLPDTVLTGILNITGDCASRTIAAIPIESRVDTAASDIGIEGEACGDEFIVSYLKHFLTTGIAAVEVDSTVNCTIENITDPSQLPAQLVKVKLTRIDPRQEMIFIVTLHDVAGNSLVERDTLGGFTLNLLGLGGDTLGIRYDRSWDGDSLSLYQQRCDSVLVTNYGSRPVNVDRAIMRGNQLYSIPPSQFPITIGPKQTRKLLVCTEGKGTDEISDTLVLMDACGHEELLLMKNPIRPLTSDGTDICGNTITVNTFAPTKRVFLTTPVPNPSGGSALVDIGLPSASAVNVEIYSTQGEHVLSVVEGAQLQAGISRINFDVSGLANGSYYCRMTTGTGEVVVQKMIVSR